jgi:hypothetical protein
MSFNILTGTTYLPGTAPPGSIAPYIGSETTDPSGWVICDGVTRSNNGDSRYNNLASLGIGSGGSGTSNYTPPNLKAAFLRGTGTASNASYVGPGVNAFQDQKIINHSHDFGGHAHATQTNTGIAYYGLRITGTNTPRGFDATVGEYNVRTNYLTLNNSDTSSTSISAGNSSVTNVTTGVETRPYNYGINWIIKL